MRALRTIIVLAALFQASCAQPRTTGFLTKRLPPVDPEQVVIYYHAAEIPGEYDKVSDIRLWARGSQDEAELEDALRKTAGKLGANGVLYHGTDDSWTGPKAAGVAAAKGMRGEIVVIAVFVHRTPKADT